MTDEAAPKSPRSLWIGLAIIVILAVGFGTGPGRRLAGKFFGSLREGKVQAVNVDLSNFVGPNANPALHQMVAQMISDKVNVTVNENELPAADASAASQLAGFHVQILSKRKDAPTLAVAGAHALEMSVDLSRLQTILKQAGRPDLVLPASLDGAKFSVRIARSVHARYGHCPERPSATANVATPTPSTTQYSDCLMLNQGPSPVVDVPAGLDIAQLAQIGLEVAGMTQVQAQDFLHTVDWKTTLGLSIPRSMRSYVAVRVNGVQGTLLNLAGRRGATYTLLWGKNGMVYGLTGFGDSGTAVSLADSLK